MSCLLAGCVSRDNFEGRDLSALKPEKESKVCLTAWKVAFEVTGHDGSVTRPIKAERLACVRVFGRGFGLPLLDGNEARVGAVRPSSFTTASFVKHRPTASLSSLSAAKYAAIGSGRVMARGSVILVSIVLDSIKIAISSD